MNRTLCLVVAIVCAGMAVLVAADVQAASAPRHAMPAPKRSPWPQGTSDIPADPDARFGVLPNGMRYILRHNTVPAHVTALRLVIDAGSLSEAEDQRGLAHMLEHMAFKGSTHVPPGEMVRLLQRHGLAFGPDTNAFTGFEQTVYQLDLPQSDDETVDVGLMLLRETASELTLNEKDLEPERGVVLSEERLSDTPDMIAAEKTMGFRMKGQLAPQRWPIGLASVIRTAPAQRIRDFYQAYYRPEMATVITVGDIDLDRMEAKIRSRFSDWKAVGKPGGRPTRGAVARRELEALVIAQPGVTPGVLVDWTGPPDLSPDRRKKEYGQHLDALATAVIGKRLSELASGDTPPFLAAGMNRDDSLKSIGLATLAVTPRGDDWSGGLRAANTVLRQALTYGVTADELAYVVAARRASLRNEADQMATRPSPQLAQQFVADLASGEVSCTPAENLRIFEEAIRGVTPADLDQRLRAMTRGQGPLLTLTTPTPLSDGSAAVLAAWRAIEATPLAPPARTAAKPWPYADLGPPATVTERHELAGLGGTFVRLSNGVRVIVKPTAYEKQSITVAVRLPGGQASLPRDRDSPGWATPFLGSGGLAKLSPSDLETTLNGRTYGMDIGFNDAAWTLGGQTVPADFPLQMQLLAALIKEPGWSPAAFGRMKDASVKMLDSLEAIPQGVLALAMSDLLHEGDPRFASLSRERIAALTLDPVKAIWTPVLAKAPIEVVIVGDVSVDTAITVAAQTFGALPQREAGPAMDQALTAQGPAPTASPIVFKHRGRADQTIGFVAWSTTDAFSEPKTAAALDLGAEIMTIRLTDKVRTAAGAAYAPSARSGRSAWLKGYGFLTASAETPPDKLRDFFAAVSAITADLRASPPTADEMRRVTQPWLERLAKARQTNRYWADAIADAADDPVRLERLVAMAKLYESVTAADIQAVARTYLTEERARRAEVLPDASARPAR